MQKNLDLTQMSSSPHKNLAIRFFWKREEFMIYRVTQKTGTFEKPNKN